MAALQHPRPLAASWLILSVLGAVPLLSGCSDDSDTDHTTTGAAPTDIRVYLSELQEFGEVASASTTSDGAVDLRLRLENADGSGLADQPISASSLVGNLLVPGELQTDQDGWVTLRVYPRLPGEDRLSFTHQRVFAELDLYVSDRSYAHPDTHTDVDPAALPEVEGVLRWELLTAVTVDEGTNGLPVARFGETQRALDGESVKLQGFMLPLEGGSNIRHFLLVRSAPSCFFCMPGGPEEVVEVRAAEAVPFSLDPMVMAGTLTLDDSGETGIFYRLESARPD